MTNMADVGQTGGEDTTRAELDALHFITHELKNSMVGIGGLAKRLMRTERDPERKKLLRVIYRQTKFLETMSSRFLLSAQIETGEWEIQPEKIEDLYEEVISPVITVLAKGPSSSPFRESRDMMETRDPIEVTADKNFLRIAYQNLLDNALKYRHQDGKVAFDVEELKDEFRCSVWNEGPGVDPKETEKIFDKFYRSGGEGTRNSKGTGLGLYTARRIIEAHGGKMWCETEPGEWIRFVFTLPKETPV
ncbi:MAG: HAMP domain-containing sensor histidine kinase [Desulfomonilaceae bacterium]|nr:HAMP domain-containing sensor histidine kinase [Desulfomonilaceae bacterium]